MKDVFDYEPFRRESEFMDRLQAEKQALEVEHADLLKQLSWSNPRPPSSPSPVERARAMLDGREAPNRAEAITALQQRELEVRHRLEVIHPAIRAQSERIEQAREAARAAAIDARAGEVKVIQKVMSQAEATLRQAVSAEDALRADLVRGGFGGSEPIYTARPWITRQALTEA